MKKFLYVMLILCMVFPVLKFTEAVVGSVVFLFLVATSDDSADKDEVLELVCDKEEELIKAIEDGDLSDFENKGFIKSVNVTETLVDFSCGGAGVGSGTSYAGFYYTSNDDMTEVWCAPSSVIQLTPSGNGFEWHEPGGDNWYYTEHICGHFYYYEATF